MTRNRRNKNARNAFLNRKSWKGYGSHKGYAKRLVSKSERRAGRVLCREARR